MERFFRSRERVLLCCILVLRFYACDWLKRHSSPLLWSRAAYRRSFQRSSSLWRFGRKQISNYTQSDTQLFQRSKWCLLKIPVWRFGGKLFLNYTEIKSEQPLCCVWKSCTRLKKTCDEKRIIILTWTRGKLLWKGKWVRNKLLFTVADTISICGLYRAKNVGIM